MVENDEIVTSREFLDRLEFEARERTGRPFDVDAGVLCTETWERLDQWINGTTMLPRHTSQADQAKLRSLTDETIHE